MNRPSLRPTRGDLILCGSLALLTLVTALGIFHVQSRQPADNLAATVTIDGVTTMTLPLRYNTTVVLPTGHTIDVRDDSIRVLTAPCRDQICVHYPPADRTGDTIICLPEKLVITIVEEEPYE